MNTEELERDLQVSKLLDALVGDPDFVAENPWLIEALAGHLRMIAFNEITLHAARNAAMHYIAMRQAARRKATQTA